MIRESDRKEAEKAIRELRSSAAKLIKRSKEFAEESLRLKQRADDLKQLIKQRDARKRK